MKKLVIFLLVLTASIGVINAQSGTCGDNLTWEFDAETGSLTISGTGEMADYALNPSYIPWYGHRSAIKTVLINDAVTSIGEYAFSYCSSLTSVTIGNSVTSIGDGAFRECSSLTSVTIGNSVTSIGYAAFYGCSSLTSITIPNSVTSIGKYAFENCSSLTSVTIPNSVTVIGNQAFAYCSSLTSITIPSSVVSIGVSAFFDCTALTSITIPNSVTSIENSAFQDCTSLTSITIPNSVTSIGDYAFYGCSSLTSVTIPNSVTSIGGYAFSGCSFLTSIMFEGLTSPIIGASIFDNTNNCPFYVPCGTKEAYVAALNVNNTIDESRVIETVIASGYCGAQGDNLTWELSCDSVLTISGTGAMADYPSILNVPWYNYRSSIKSVIINDGVTSIGKYAFWSCSSLTSITIPNSVTSIGYQAFYGCSSLTSVTIPNSVTSIDKNAFYYCSSLTSINVDANNSNYSSTDGVLFNKDKTTLIECPSGKQGVYTIPNSVTSIENGAFYSCKSLASITIPNNVTSIGNSAFYECSSFTSVTIPNSVTSIGNQAFHKCSSLTSVTIPNSVTSIGDSAFYYCSSLTSVIIPNSVTSIGGRAFYGCSSLTSVTIPNSVTSIGSWAFSYCSSLTSITIPNSVTSIGEYTFYGCSSLTSVTIPNSVTSIGDRAFEGCKSLTSVTFGATTPPRIGYVHVFYDTNNCLFYVPCGTKEAYVAALNANNTIEVSRVIETIASGTCGDNLTWELSCDSVLTISGTGAMADYAYNTMPWYDYRSSILSIVISDGVTSIGDNAFSRYSTLTSVTIPNSVTSIGYMAFSECTSLTNIIIGDGITRIKGGAFHHIPIYSNESVWENEVLYIGKYLIAVSVNKQGSYTLKEGTLLIADGAFSDCSSLTSLTIPNSVTGIGENAFLECSGLTSVTFEGSTPPVFTENVFYFAKECPIYVPCGTKEAYVAALNVNNTIDESRVIEKSPYTYSIASSDNTLGSVIITQEPTTCAEPLIFRADAAEGYQFAQWSDGNTDNPRSLILIQDTTLKAEFELTKYIVIWQDEEGNVIKEDKVMQGEMPEYIGEEPAKDSTAEYSYVFAGWLPRIKPVTENIRYTTYFIPQKLTPEKVYTVNINGENCSLNISNEYPEGAVVTVEAVADDCFKFEKWSDNNTDNPRTITVTEDSVLTAEFTKLIYTIKGANQSSTGGSVQVVNP